MNKEKIITEIMEKTDWTSLYLLKKRFFKNKGWRSVGSIDEFQYQAESLLTRLLKDNDSLFISSGMLSVYREKEDENTEVIGIRFDVPGYEVFIDKKSS